MTSLERVTLALNHKEPDHVPVYPLINSVSWKTTGITREQFGKDAELCAEAILKATEEVGTDVLCTLVDLSVEAADWGQEIVYGPVEAAHPNDGNRLIKSREDYGKIGVINPRETPRMSEHIKLAKLLPEAKGQEMPVVGFVFGPLGVLSMLRGQSRFFVDLLKCPEQVHKALRGVTDTLKEFSIALIEAGCHAIMFDTLYASKTILRSSMWETFEGPYIKELSDAVRAHGAMVMLHNCGDGIYFEQQIQYMDPVALSYAHLPPDCASMAELKEKYGQKITLIGDLELGFLVTATEDEVRAKCRSLIDAYKRGGGFILATGCEYPTSLDLTYAKIMVEEARTYGAYK